jgi:hypothetical protein
VVFFGGHEQYSFVDKVWAQGPPNTFIAQHCGLGPAAKQNRNTIFKPPALQFFLFCAAAYKIVNNFDCPWTGIEIGEDAE